MFIYASRPVAATVVSPGRWGTEVVRVDGVGVAALPVPIEESVEIF